MERVWDYPRPPAIERCRRRVRVKLGGESLGRLDARAAGARDEPSADRLRAQDSGFYGGWVTADLVGPFKGPPGTRGW
jgi:hypothetical protein